MRRDQLHALLVAIFPVALATGILTIPVVSDYSNHILVEQAVSQTARWFWGHTISGVAFGLSILAACYITEYLSSKGQSRSGALSLSLIAIGDVLYAFGLGADGIGPSLNGLSAFAQE